MGVFVDYPLGNVNSKPIIDPQKNNNNQTKCPAGHSGADIRKCENYCSTFADTNSLFRPDHEFLNSHKSNTLRITAGAIMGVCLVRQQYTINK